MKIGLVLSNPPAYSETFFNSKIKGLLEKGFEPTLFVQKNTANFKLCKVKTAPKIYTSSIVQLIAMGIVYISLIPKITSVIRYINLERKEQTSWPLLCKRIYLNAHLLKAKVNWIHFGFATQALGSETVAQAIGAKMAVSFRGFDINVYPIKNKGAYELVWKYTTKIHSISNNLLQSAYNLGLKESKPYQIITPAVSDKLIGVVQDIEIKNEPLEILTIARLHWIKGIDLLIETAALLKDMGITYTWKVIGDTSSQKDLERYKYHMYEKGVQNEVLLIGKQSHKETLNHLKQAKLYVQTSLNEGFCNAVLEAQALGKLAIATNVGGISENSIDRQTGFLVPKNNALELANKIKEVMSLPKEEINKISTAARNRVASQFTIEKQQQEFVKFYSEA